MDVNADLESLKKVHQTLIEAIKTAESAVNAQLAQRRFWLEEICSNLDESGGLQNASSIWKRPIPVKIPPAKKNSAKAISLKRKKNSLESSGPKPTKKPRKKKNEMIEITTKPTPKKGPTVKIKMRTLPVSAEVRAPSPDSGDTESQKDDDEESSSASSYQMAQPTDRNSDWETAANDNPLAMMAAVAYGTSSASDSPEARSVHDHPPITAPLAQHRPPQHHYAPHGVRTYTSLEDVGASDDDSDEDKF